MSVVSCERVQTARLLCERLRLEHEAEMSILLRDPRVAKTLTPNGLPPSAREVLDGLRAKISHWERFGFGLWMVRDRASGEPRALQAAATPRRVLALQPSSGIGAVTRDEQHVLR